MATAFRDCFGDRCGQKDNHDNNGLRKGQGMCLQCVARLIRQYNITDDSAGSTWDGRNNTGMGHGGRRPRDDDSSTEIGTMRPTISFSACGVNSTDLPTALLERLDAPYDGSVDTTNGTTVTPDGTDSKSASLVPRKLASGIVVVAILAALF